MVADQRRRAGQAPNSDVLERIATAIGVCGRLNADREAPCGVRREL